MSTVTTEKLSENVGVEVLDVDVERLRDDDELAAATQELLEHHGVVLFRKVDVDDDTQSRFVRKLGETALFPAYSNPEIMEISFDPSNPNAEYLASNGYWHMDGLMDKVPAKTGVLSAKVLASKGGETEFASTYLAYDTLSDEEKDEVDGLRVRHTFEAVQRKSYPNPTPAQLAEWASRPEREHPLVWKHESGRKSLVFGASAANIVGWGAEESAELLADLQHRATTPDRVLRHTWTVGDMVLWDNTGLAHRVAEFDHSEPRRLHRSTIKGTEPIK